MGKVLRYSTDENVNSTRFGFAKLGIVEYHGLVFQRLHFAISEFVF